MFYDFTQTSASASALISPQEPAQASCVLRAAAGDHAGISNAICSVMAIASDDPRRHAALFAAVDQTTGPLLNTTTITRDDHE